MICKLKFCVRCDTHWRVTRHLMATEDPADDGYQSELDVLFKNRGLSRPTNKTPETARAIGNVIYHCQPQFLAAQRPTSRAENQPPLSNKYTRYNPWRRAPGISPFPEVIPVWPGPGKNQVREPSRMCVTQWQRFVLQDMNPFRNRFGIQPKGVQVRIRPGRSHKVRRFFESRLREEINVATLNYRFSHKWRRTIWTVNGNGQAGRGEFYGGPLLDPSPLR